MKPYFSIIIPTYNRANLLHTTLVSIQHQTWSHWEVHVVDDGSIDHTKDIMEAFRSDTRFHYHLQDHGGPAGARNLGMEKAKGDIFTFVDSDDPLYPHYLEAGIQYLFKDNQKSFALSHCDFFYELYDREGRLLKRKSASSDQRLDVSLQDVYNWNVRLAIGTGLFLKPQKFKGKVQWNPDIIPGDDIEFIMQLACIDSGGFVYIPKALFEYRQRYGGDGLCSNTPYGQWAEMFQKIHDLHKDDVLMKEPQAYLRRVEKYRRLQKQFDQNEVVPPHLKYFPEHWEK
ncbi:MAG: glycosyltransferase family 2 protein [Alphaproteobacteria bacterium]|jgi:glycosyltransferase involved in cell wall biosynthesis|nr:glycosyltransferase family 2 protein [Alphaproteobacteria bacterium]